MATNDFTSPITLDPDRAHIARMATYEIEHLAELIIKECHDEAQSFIYRGIAVRINSLNGVLMSALGDPNVTTASLASVVRRGIDNG